MRVLGVVAIGALAAGGLWAAAAMAAEDGRLGTVSRGSIGLTLVKPETVAVPSGFTVQMQPAGDAFSGATTQCLTGTRGSNPPKPAPLPGAAVLVQARDLGPCAGGGRAWRLWFRGGNPASPASRNGAVLLRPE